MKIYLLIAMSLCFIEELWDLKEMGYGTASAFWKTVKFQHKLSLGLCLRKTGGLTKV